MTRGEVLKRLSDSGFPVMSRKRLSDNAGDQLFLGKGVVVTCYNHGGYSILGKNYPTTIDTVNTVAAILKKEVVKEKEADITDFGGIIGVGV
jgi:hypothetical protein